MKIRKIIIIGYQNYLLRKQNCVIFIMTTYARFYARELLIILFRFNNEYLNFVSVECMICRPTLF